jgi:hypothetical protein
MNWDAIGAAGEVIGALAVVLTLAYLAIQIRQSTATAKMAAMQNIIQAGVDHTSRIADNSELAEMINRAFDDPSKLTNVERTRVNCHLITLYHHLDGAFHMHMAGMLETEIWEKFAFEGPIWIQVPFIRDWYELEKMRLTPAFQTWLEGKLAEVDAPPVMPGYGRPLPSS